MNVPLEITYRNVVKSEYIDQLIRQQCAKLEKVCNYISSCRVVVEKPQAHHQSGRAYRVRVVITVPAGHKIISKKEPTPRQAPKERVPLPTIIRNVFKTASEELNELIQRQRREVKTHPNKEKEGIVAKLDYGRGFGFLRALDGCDIYFHRNSVLNGGFDKLEIGTGVWFREEPADKGPQAAAVRIIDKPGHKRFRPVPGHTHHK